MSFSKLSFGNKYISLTKGYKQEDNFSKCKKMMLTDVLSKLDFHSKVSREVQGHIFMRFSKSTSLKRKATSTNLNHNTRASVKQLKSLHC